MQGVKENRAIFVSRKGCAMKNESTEINLNLIQEQLPKEAVGNEVALLEDISGIPLFDYPCKISVAVATICLAGEISGSINLKPYRLLKNDFLIAVPGQIVQFASVSNDFSGRHILMSAGFLENLELNMNEAISVFLHLKESQITHLDTEEMEHLLDYYSILRKAVKRVQSPHRIEIVRALTQAIFYGLNDFEQLKRNAGAAKTGKEILFDSFYKLILQHYKTSREVGFYAEKLCLTPKYLSTVIKEVTGKSAFEWINNYVVLEARSMLKSTGMTIQQISNELNFPNQSFFGKYFKRMTGTPPKNYRRGQTR